MEQAWRATIEHLDESVVVKAPDFDDPNADIWEQLSDVDQGTLVWHQHFEKPFGGSVCVDPPFGDPLGDVQAEECFTPGSREADQGHCWQAEEW